MATIFIIGYVYDTVNQVYVRPTFLFDGVVVQAALGEIFTRVDVEPGSYQIEMITEGYTFDYWGIWEDDVYWPSFADMWANPTIISALGNSYFYCMVHPTTDPFETKFVETYRGVDIHQYTLSGWYTFTYAEMIYSLPPPLSDVRAYIDDLIAAAEEPQFIETYRGVDIYWLPTLEMFRAVVAPGYTSLGTTLEECKASIDEIIAYLEEPDPDPTSILNQIMTQVLIWVGDNLGAWLQPVYDWINSGLAAAGAAWDALFAEVSGVVADLGGALTSLATTVGDRWDNFTTLTLPSIWDTITAQAAALQGSIDLKGTELEGLMTTKLADFAVFVQGLLGELDPHNILPDPQGYIATAFNTLIQPWVQNIVKSFKEGLEEGQTS